MNDLDTISHLDFEVEIEKQECCDRFVSVSLKSQTVLREIECGNPPILRALRSCCGRLDSLCQRCYNTMIDHAAVEGAKCRFCSNVRPLPPYATVNFI